MKAATERINFSQISSKAIAGIFAISFVFLLSAAGVTPARAEVILVTDMEYGSQKLGGLFAVDVSGFRSLLSDFNDTAQGPLGYNPAGVAVESSGGILVVDVNAGATYHGALFRIDAYGIRTVVSDFGNLSQGKSGYHPYAVEVENSGQILVVDQDTGDPYPTGCRYGALFRVDPTNGNRTVLSNFCNPAQGTLAYSPFCLAVEKSGSILISDSRLLIRVDPSTGYRTVLSDLTDSNQGPTGLNSYDVSVEPSGSILVATSHNGINNYGAIFRVDATNGNRTLLSDFGDPAQGRIGAPIGMEVTSAGQILAVVTVGTSTGALIVVDSITGNRTIVSDFTNPLQGPLGVLPYKVTSGTIPPPPGAPPAPSNLQARLGMGSRGPDVILQWDDNSLNEDFFEVWRSVDGVSYGTAAYATTTTSYFVDENVRIRYPVKEPPYYPFRYCYKVRAVNSFGASDFCDYSCPLLPPATREDLTASGLPGPPAPRVVLSWTNPDYGDPPTLIKISRSLDPRGPFFPYDEIPYVSSANGVYDDTGVITGQQYCYQIVATNGSSIASRSLPNQVCSTVPQPLTIYNFRYRVTPHSVTFTWDTNVATRGDVSLSGPPPGRSHSIGTHHTITFNHLTEQTTYSFDVMATRIAEPHDSVHQSGNFTTPDPSTYMYISNVNLSTTATSATITWVTSTRADGTVEYGTEDAGVCNYTNTLPSGTNVINHSATISNLQPETRYCYRLTATRGSDTDEYLNTFETAGMPQLEIQSVSGPFLRKNESGSDVDTKPWYMEYKVQIRNNRGRTALEANQVAIITDATTLDVPCDQLRELSEVGPLWDGCYSPVESVPLSLSPSPPVDIPPDGSSEVSLIFPVRVPLRGLIGSGANLHLGLSYQYASGSDTVSTTSDFTASVPLQHFGLSISVSDSPDPVSQQSGVLVYRIKITNGGICDYDDEPCVSPPFLVYLDWNPWGQDFNFYSVGFKPKSPTCSGQVDPQQNTLECEIPGLPKGAVATGRVIFVPPWFLPADNRQLKIRASLWQSSAPDPYPFDDSVTEFTTIGSGGATNVVNITDWVRGEMTYINPISCIDYRDNQQKQGAHAYYTYCNYGTSSYTLLGSEPTVMPQEAYIDGSLDFSFNSGYEDGVLDPGECVEVLYSICALPDMSLMRQARFRILGVILP